MYTYFFPLKQELVDVFFFLVLCPAVGSRNFFVRIIKS